MALTKVTTHVIADDIALGGNPTTTTQSAGNNTTRIATTAFVTGAIADLSDSAPSTLNTLNELAAALGDDANFSTTVTNSIATKLPLAGGSLTGGLNITAGGDNLKLKRSSFDDILLGIGTGNSQSGLHITNTTDTVTIASIHENAPAGSLVMDSSGNIGIGTAGSPDGNLEIRTDNAMTFGSDTVDSITIGTSGTNKPCIKFDTADTTHTNRVWAIENGAGNRLNFFRNGLDVLKLNQDGSIEIPGDDVLIGSSTNLNVLSGTPKIQVGDGSGHASIQWYSGAGSVAGLYFGDASSGSARYEGYIEYRHNNNQMAFRTQGTDRFYINSDGNVGVGTNAPNQWASYTDSAATVLQVRDTGQRARMVINGGNGAHLDLVDYAGASNDKHMNIAVDGGLLKFGSLNDAGNAFVNSNIMVQDLGTGHVGVGHDNPVVRFHAYHPTTNVVGRFESGDDQVWIDLHDSGSGNYGALLGHDGTFDFMVANDAVDQMLSIRRASRMVEIGNGYGIVAENGRSAQVSISTSFTTVLNMNTLGTGDSRGFYLVTVCREGGSVGTNYIALIGASSTSNSYIYEVLTSNSLAGQMSGSNLQIRLTSGSTALVHTTCIPIGIHANDS